MALRSADNVDKLHLHLPMEKEKKFLCQQPVSGARASP